MHAAYGGHIHFEKNKKKIAVVWKFECLYDIDCLSLVNKVEMEQIIVLRNHESAFWKKGMFFDGELWSSVGISRCCATPIINYNIDAYGYNKFKWNKLFWSWKSWIGILKANSVFRCACSEVLRAVLCESRARKLCTTCS